MKKIFNIIALLALAFATAGLTACSDYEEPAKKDKGKTPVVKYVRVCDPEKSDSLIVAASLGQKIAFVGDNLGDVQQIWFNDLKASINPNLVTSNVIIVDVPGVIAGEVTNTVRMITSTGIEITYPFEVTVPGPRILTANNEYTKPGEVMTLTGAYFVDDPNVPITVTFANNLPAKIVTFDQSQMQVEVPEGAVEGPITIKTIYGEGQSPFYYRDSRGMIFDFSTHMPINGTNGWHSAPIVDDEYAIAGPYILLNGDGGNEMDAAGSTWNEEAFGYEYWPGGWTGGMDGDTDLGPIEYDATSMRIDSWVDLINWENANLKFELMIPKSNPWQAGGMQLIFTSSATVSLGRAGTSVDGYAMAGSNNNYFSADNQPRAIYSPWSATEAFHTSDQWITVSIPMSEFRYTSQNTSCSTPMLIQDFAGMSLLVNAGGKEGVACSPIFRIDNVRIVNDL